LILREPVRAEEHSETFALPSRDLTYRRFRLTVKNGPDAGKDVLSDSAEVFVGSSVTGNHLVLTDSSVSRHHFSITAGPDGFLLRDLGSTNGTELGGYQVQTAFLKHDALIGTGRTTLTFEVVGDEISEPISPEERYGRLLGASASMRRIFNLLPRIASSDSTVLLEGETGTGKGLLAEAIHGSSPRAKGPLIVVDCGSIPPTLIESELFGHEKGAFTGAINVRAGAFEAAQGGTVFLDEIGELPLEMQPKLLRALEERVVKRVGATSPIALDVRVIAATHRDLRREVNQQRFRADLFYRLNIVRIRIPPLRDRREDLPMLVDHFHAQFSRRSSSPPPELLESFLSRDWPGNVRELRAAVERAVLLGSERLEDSESLTPREDARSDRGASAGGAASPERGAEVSPAVVLDSSLSFRAAKERAIARWEKEYIAELVRTNDGNLSRAARAARMDRNHLRELLKRHGIGADDDTA
jgi:DNA-binding NtrC family response regulator